MADIGLVESQIVALFLESLMFGMFIPLYIAAVWILVNKSGAAGGLNTSLITVCTLLLALGIAHLSIDLRRIFIALSRTDLAPASAFYLNISHPTEVAKTYVYVTQTLVADAFLLFRCFVVWQKSLKMIFLPAILYLSCTAIGFYGTYRFSLVPPNATIFQLTQLKPCILSFFTLTLATNFTCTCLIAYPIWKIKRRMTRAQPQIETRIWRALAVIIESGAVYSAGLLTLLAMYLGGTNVQYPVLDMMNPLIGVVFTLILVRIGLGIASGADSRGLHMHSTGIAGESRNGLALRPMSINVSVIRSTCCDEQEPSPSPNAQTKFISQIEKNDPTYEDGRPSHAGWAA